MGFSNNDINRIIGRATSVESLSNEKIGKTYEAVHNEITTRLSTADSLPSLTRAATEMLELTDSAVIKETVESVYFKQIAQHYKEWMSADAVRTAESTDGVIDASVEAGEIQEGFVGEKSGTAYTAEQAEVLGEIPSDILNMAFGYTGNGENGVKAVDVGIDTESEFYKKLESAGLANSNGMINGAAVLDEARRRAEIPKPKAAEGSTDVEAESEIAEPSREITVNMSETERAEILRNKSVVPVDVSAEQSEHFDFEDLKNNIKSKVEKTLLKKFRELGFLKKYSSAAIGDIEFEFTGKGFNKSLHSQENHYGGTKADFAKIGMHLQELLDTAVLIETHTDKGRDTAQEKRGLQQVYVLHGVLIDNGFIVPVQLEVEQYTNKENRLYLVVALTKIETGVEGNTASDNQTATSLVPISNISIPDLFAKINPDDGKFLKYIPDEFLNDEQLASKRRAQKEDAVKYRKSEQGGFTDVPDSEIQRERTVEDEALDFATGKYRNPRQRQVEKVAEVFGIKVRWDENVSRAFYNFDSHFIFMNPKLTLSEMYAVVFKHELVHHLELKKGYDGFKKYLFKNSVAFADYVKRRVEQYVSHGRFDGSVDEAIKAYTEYKYEQYKNSPEIPENARNRFTTEMAEMEIVADFVGDRMFGENADTSMKALEELAETDRNLFQRIWDWIKDILAKFKKRGDVQDASIRKDIDYLEKRMARVWDSKDKKNSTANVGVKYKLDAYSQHQKDNWATSKRIVLYENDEQYRGFIEDSLSGNITDKKIYFGAVSTELANFIKHCTGINVENYNCSLSSDEILKINKDHGNQAKEELRGQRAVTVQDFLKLPLIIQNADTIVLSSKLYNGKPVISFIQNSNEKITVSAVVSDKRMDLFIQTAFINTKKGNLATPTADQATVNTPEASSGTVSNTIIRNTGENVKHSIGLAKDAVFEPEKVAGELTDKYGESSMDSVTLRDELNKVMSAIDRTHWAEAYELAQKIAESFDSTDTNAIADDIYNKVVNVRDTQVWFEADTVAKQNAEVDNRDNLDKRGKRSESEDTDGHSYHEQMEKKRLDREDRQKNLKHFRDTRARLETRLKGNTDAKHIPEHLKDVIKSFINTFQSGVIDEQGLYHRIKQKTKLTPLEKQCQYVA